jgi:hypothetical protein
MISRHTPPGTAVVCIDASGLCTLADGRRYIIERMAPVQLKAGGVEIGAVLAGVTEPTRGLIFWRWRFRRAELPDCLTRLLEVAPSPVPSKVAIR